MNYLSIEGLSKNYGEKILYDQLNFSIHKKEKIALIARNGTGKTSLLKTIVGLESPNSDAKIEISKHIRIGYLPQAPDFDLSKTIEEYIYQSDSTLVQTVLQYEHAIMQTDEKNLQHWMSEMDRLDAWDLDARIKEILGKLDLHDLTQNISTLSGGQKKRLALAQILIDSPDFLVLDEPTNHLDPPMIKWLEQWLGQDNITLLLVTHDRYFLDNVCNVIYELEKGVLQIYTGNYSDYLEKKNLRLISEKSSLEKTKNLYRKELEWIRKQPKARGTKAKSRVDAFDVIEQKAKVKIEDERVKLEIDAERMGTKILEFHNVCKSYGDKIILDKFSYKFKRFEKVGITGRNGVGKTSFIKLITGEDIPDSGTVIVGETIKIGYYTQELQNLPMDLRAIEVVTNIASFIPLKGGKTLSASQLLERFLFTHDDQYTYVNKLSGGEQKRLQLLCILIQNPNFLILDEPTNDLDLHTMMALEDFLEDFPGCVLVITHDRYFLDKVAEHIFIFEGDGQVKDYNGKFSQYVFDEKTKEKKAPATKTVEPVIIEEKVVKEKKKLSYKDQREYELLPNEIQQLESQKKQLEADLSTHASDYNKVAELSLTLAQVNEAIDHKSLRWLELSEIVEG